MSQHKNFLIIIQGPPGAGKSTLARRLARDLELPYLTKDDLKEILFETLGWDDREWSKKLGGASFEILFYLIERQLAVKKMAIVETAFYTKEHTDRFLALKQKYHFEPIQVMCNAQANVLFERFNNRALSGERHPGHVDHLGTYDGFMDVLGKGRYGILEIGGHLIDIDTTVFETIHYDKLFETIRAIILPN